jgi:hypothetical protein
VLKSSRTTRSYERAFASPSDSSLQLTRNQAPMSAFHPKQTFAI